MVNGAVQQIIYDLSKFKDGAQRRACGPRFLHIPYYSNGYKTERREAIVGMKNARTSIIHRTDE